ncbi:MAG: hypothetical protein NC399_06240 [Muribaculum sp.]|nr:hypothetical protein [Muribaculum sp.]
MQDSDLYSGNHREAEEESLPESGQAKDAAVEDIIRLLDDYTQSGGSRMKLQVEEGEGEILSRAYHHGRCDVGSPWAKGQPFDVLDCGD